MVANSNKSYLKQSALLNKRGKQKANIEKEINKLVKQYFSTTNGGNNLHQALITRVERALLEAVLKQTQDNQSEAARILGISRTTLRKKMTQLELDSITKPAK